MAKNMTKYSLPMLEEALDTRANDVLAYATSHIEGLNVDWTDIPPQLGRLSKRYIPHGGRLIGD